MHKFFYSSRANFYHQAGTMEVKLNNTIENARESVVAWRES